MEEQRDRQQSTRRWMRHVLCCVAGVLCVFISLNIAPSGRVESPLGEIEVRARLEHGGTYLDIPPLGSVEARTHSAFVGVHIELRRLEIEQVGERVQSGESTRDLTKMRQDLRGAFLMYTLSAVGTCFVLLVLLMRKKRLVIETGVWAGALMLGLGAVSAVQFDADAFSQSTFHGSLSEAPEVMRRVDRAIEGIGDAKQRLDVISKQLEALTTPLEDTEGAVTVLHVSDIHSNPIGFQWVTQLVKRFEPDVVVDTGDITSFGYEAETQSLLRSLGVPREQYLVAYGNHDAQGVREKLNERLRGIDQKVVDVGGVRILGWDDPTFTAQEGNTNAELRALYAASGEKLRERCLKERPDVVAVHNPEMASYVDGCAKSVLSGHWHQSKQFKLPRGTIVSVSGTSGAGGVEGVSPDGVYEAELLRYKEGVLVGIDVVRMNPTSGEAEVRHLNPERITRKHSVTWDGESAFQTD
jgi:predicted MPP superfamily phosphohydrolase